MASSDQLSLFFMALLVVSCLYVCLYYYQQVQDVLSAVLSAAQLARNQQVQDVLSAVLSAAQLARSQQVQNALNCQWITTHW